MKQENNAEAVLRIIGTAVGAGIGISSIVKASTSAFKAVATTYGDDVARAIAEYGDDLIKIESKFGKVTADKIDDILKRSLDDVAGSAGKSLETVDWSNFNNKGQSALDHIQKHSAPNYQRDLHGVFNGNSKNMVEQAWANRAAGVSISDGMGGTIYNIPYQNAGYNSGYLYFGQQMDYITIVVKDGTSTIWTAFPSFGNYGMKITP